MAIYVDIKKSFPRFTLSIQLESGNGVLALLGASGSGKSMLLKCIAGIVKPDAGIIAIDDKVVFDDKKNINIIPQKRNVGFLFQNYALFPHMTVRENIGIVIEKSKAEKEKIIEQNLAAFYLKKVASQYPSQLSGGQQQRTALARIFATSPAILMLDEPFSALDSFLRWKLVQSLAQHLEGFGGSSIYVSHDNNEAFKLSDKIAILHNGTIDCIEDKQALLETPKTLTATKLMGCKNISRAEKIGESKIAALDWNLELHCSEAVPANLNHVAIQSHHIKITDTERDNTFIASSGEIDEDPLTLTITIHLNASEEGQIQIVTTEKAKSKITPKEKIMIHMPADKLILLTK